jgi:predicted ester cyclase
VAKWWLSFLVPCRAGQQDRVWRRRCTPAPAGSNEQEVGQVPEKENHNKRTVLRLYEEVGNEGRLEVLDEIAWPDHIEHCPFPGQSQGVEGLKQRVSMVRAAFNPQFTIEHLMAEGDKVAVMWRNQGTHVGEWFGFSPTGKGVTAHGVDIHLLRDGRLAEHWDVVDISGFLMAVGAVSASAGTAGAQR